ncbi:hypothetical protein [Psychrilyobacter atlanticus]|uniref:hypothetical protein n=1 Tax=Psychrilyobacter atlanticus TaxID=271091 RepID=UPI0004060C9B|nr:hypothetical protein [Psychrilyobacter atlanticus]
MFAEEIKELTEILKVKKNELKRVERQFVRLKNEVETVEIKIEKLEELSNIEGLNVEKSDGKIKKCKAIEIVNREKNKGLKSRDVIFSNRNKTTGEWWVEPTPKKFGKILNLLLNDRERNKLYLFEIPKEKYSSPNEKFKYREDKGLYSIKIDGNDIHEFKDELGSGVCFGKYLKDTIDY